MANEFDPINSRLSNVESKVDRLPNIEAKLDALAKRVDEIAGDVRILRGDVDNLKAWRTVGGSLAGGGAILVLGFALFAGKAVLKEAAREVIREEFAHYATTVQPGKLNAANRAPGETRSYVWKLAAPIAPGSLVLMTAELIPPAPGVALSAELVDDGAACRMTLHGDAAAIRGLTEPLDAKVTLTARR